MRFLYQMLQSNRRGPKGYGEANTSICPPCEIHRHPPVQHLNFSLTASTPGFLLKFLILLLFPTMQVPQSRCRKPSISSGTNFYLEGLLRQPDLERPKRPSDGIGRPNINGARERITRCFDWYHRSRPSASKNLPRNLRVCQKLDASPRGLDHHWLSSPLSTSCPHLLRRCPTKYLYSPVSQLRTTNQAACCLAKVFPLTHATCFSSMLRLPWPPPSPSHFNVQAKET